MITKVEAGKTYRLIDKEGYLAHNSFNKPLYVKYFLDDTVTIGEVCHSSGVVDDYEIITSDEYKFFEEVVSEESSPKIIKPEDEITITTTYGDLARAYYAVGRINGKDYDKNIFDIACEVFKDNPVHNLPSMFEGPNYHSFQSQFEKELFDKLNKNAKEQLQKQEELAKIDAQIAELQQKRKELEG